LVLVGGGGGTTILLLQVGLYMVAGCGGTGNLGSCGTMAGVTAAAA
jgi:hypothetical protein